MSHRATTISIFPWCPTRSLCTWDCLYPSIILWMGGRWATQELAGGAATLIYRLERLSITLDGKVVWSSATVQESRSSIAPQDLFLPTFCYTVSRRTEELLCEEAGLDVLLVSTLRGKRVNVSSKGQVWIIRTIPRLPISPSCSGQL